jgi:hypothetical protein
MKQLHIGWEYNSVPDPTQETSSNLAASKMVELLHEMFQNINSYPTPEHVCTYHLKVLRDLVR